MFEVTIHQYNEYGYYTGQCMVIEETGAIPPYWTDASFPQISDGQYAVFDGFSWRVTSDPQPEPLPSIEETIVPQGLPAETTVI
jgi:hypothetical protein